MLPAARWQLLVSKLLTSIVWMAVCAIVTVGSALLLASYPELYRQMGVAIRDLDMLIRHTIGYLNMPAWLLILELVLLIVFSVLQNVLMLYASVSIGQLFRRYRFFGAVAGYLLLYALVQIVSGVWTLIAGFAVDSILGTVSPFADTLSGLGTFQLQTLAVTYLVLLALVTFLFWTVTHGVMKRAVNLR